MVTDTQSIAIDAPRARLSTEERILVGAVGYFLFLKVVFAFNASPFGDEAYYWMWGQHPALSYFDHPPLQAWLQGISTALFGPNLFALRWLTFAAVASNLWVFSLAARRLAGDAWRVWFLRSAAIYLAAPLYGFFGTVAFHDYLLVALLTASGYFFVCYFTDVERAAGRTRNLFIAAALLGLAGLAKYNAAFLGLAVVGAIVTRPQLRHLLLRWQLWAAGAVTVAMQAPVLLWNIGEDLGSFAFHLGARHGTEGLGGFTGLNFGSMKQFAGEAMLMTSPFLVVPVVLFFWARQRSTFERVGKTLAIWMFWPSTLVCLYIVSFHAVLWWWNIVAFVLIFPFLGRYMTGWLLGLHIAWGAAINTFLTVNFAVVPVLVALGQPTSMEVERAYGWPEVVATLKDAQRATGAALLAANGFELASQAGFHLNDPDVLSLRTTQESFDDWTDYEALRGQAAIVLSNPEFDQQWREHFETIELVRRVEARHWAGYLMDEYEVYHATGFRPVR
jgi:4-amino-4-deoxy-L-arabinose transferase-like glycosyltransferase